MMPEFSQSYQVMTANFAASSNANKTYSTFFFFSNLMRFISICSTVSQVYPTQLKEWEVFAFLFFSENWIVLQANVPPKHTSSSSF